MDKKFIEEKRNQYTQQRMAVVNRKLNMFDFKPRGGKVIVSLSLTKEALEVVKEYMEMTNVNFNNAVDQLIRNNKQ